jgi:ATP-dependent Lon protease
MANVHDGKRTGEEYPAIPLHCSVVYPGDVVSIQLSEDVLLADAVEREVELTVATLYPREEGKEPHSVAVVCRVVQCMQLPGGGVQAVFQGLYRARILERRELGDQTLVRVERVPPDDADTPETNQRVLDILDLLGEYLPRDGSYPEDLENILRMNVRGPGRFADLCAAYLNLPVGVKREVAVTNGARDRLDVLVTALRVELDRHSVEADVHRRVRDQIEERQREQYLRQQMRAIRRELGDEPEEENDELVRRIEAAGLPPEAREVADRELRRLRSVTQSSAEYQVIRTYLGWILDLPWKNATTDRLDVRRARAILDDSHAGLDKVKERIVEHLAVRKLKNDTRGPVLCLVGPPGVGKTSLGRAVAKALGRKFVRMSVGGLRDEAEIKGHRRTYVGAMPGKILQLMKRAGVRNPVLQIDEIDKMGADARGDPASAVLEVLDAECHNEFRDHYLDVGFDLSEVFFVVTANLLDPIPAALRDRLEILRLGGYTRHDKITIARRHLVPRALEDNGLAQGHVRFTTAGLERIIDGYTREAGLRELERSLSSVCRKLATRYVEGHHERVCVGKTRVRELLGAPPFRPDLAGRRPEVGVATGLAWTAFGGTLLTIEATRMPGKGRIEVTGHLGDVMQESARTALSYIRSNAEEFDIDADAFRHFDIHIHFPEGATPKDGPSAGVAVATCLASLLTHRPVRHDLAMTGEITLTGKVLEVGGIKEKLLAAHRAGIRHVIIPKDNVKDLDEIPRQVRRDLNIIGSEDVLTNICEALLSIVVADDATLTEVESERAVQQGQHGAGARRAR